LLLLLDIKGFALLLVRDVTIFAFNKKIESHLLPAELFTYVFVCGAGRSALLSGIK
jgi:hypothetical protein